MTTDRLNSISSVNEDRFDKLFHYGAVTFLKIYKEYIIAGYGPCLKVFRVIGHNQTSLVFDEQVFQRNKIHHIDIDLATGKMVISGAQSFMVLNFDLLIENLAASFVEKTVNEWITTSCFADEDHVLLLNSHNTVIKVNIQDYSIVERIDCNEKSILYSGSIAKLPNGEVYVAAGTVMSGVIIWNLKSRKIKHVLTEHEGSIFGVKIDSSGGYITTCSDDRSIKLYNFEDGKLLSTGWGHGSRIWNLNFFKPELKLGDCNVRIVSCGEDCTLRIWEYIPGNELLIQRELWENYHRGKHIWSGDVDNSNLNLVVTGGADGKIRLHDLSCQNTSKFSLSAISEAIDTPFGKAEFIRDYYELEDRDILTLLTSSGYLVMYSNGVFISLGQFQEFSSFGIVSGFSDLNVVLIGASNGDILCIDYCQGETPKISWIRDVSEIIGGSKVKNMHFHYSNERSFMLVDCPNPTVPFILAEFSYSKLELTISTLSRVPKADPKFPLTSFAIDITNNWLVLASKKVSIQVTDLASMNSTTFRKLSPGDTISLVSVIKSEKSFADLLILARDGTYTIARIKIPSPGLDVNPAFDFHLEVLQQNKVSRGFIEGGFMHEKDLILYGFKSSYFFIWNETKQIEIMNENCGGTGHRNFKFYTSHNHDVFKFIYTNKDELCIRTHKIRFIDNFGLIQNGSHGREIRDLAISKDKKLVVTSSEDSSIGISRFSGSGEIVQVWSMNNHISGMQKIKFLNDKFIGSSAANEEFIIWKLTWEDDISLIVEHSRLQPTKSVPDLRVMDFCSFETDNGFILATVYSDSNVKIWNFDIKSGFKLIDSFFYRTCCILNCDFIVLNDCKYLVFGSTDGCVLVWNITRALNGKTLVSVITKQLHQSGVKALELLQENNSYIMVTGGDDNGIAVSRIHLGSSDDVQNLKIDEICSTTSAASATITSISFLSSAKKFVATSVDQIVRLWSFELGHLECIGATYTTVADTGCCDTIQIDGKDVLVIGGAGISSWRIN